MKIEKKAEKNIELIKQLNNNSSDIVDRVLEWEGKKIAYSNWAKTKKVIVK